MGLIDSFSSAYDSYTAKAGEMGLVSFKRIFLIDYKACIIFKNRPSTNDTVRTQNISEMAEVYQISTKSLHRACQKFENSVSVVERESNLKRLVGSAQ